MKKPELLAPAGDWRMLRTAVQNGADAVYFGIGNLNMRAKAKNFTLEDLPEIVKYCKENNVDTHLTLNTIIYENEIDKSEEIVKKAKEAGVDLVICWDTSVIQQCKKHNMPFCISTQASISNSGAVEFYKSLGASRVVLARECTLDQIKEIMEKTDIEIETFVHGAMCVAVSGRCFMSHEVFNKSANRGECIQPCRREYEIRDKDDKHSFILGSDYVMSPKDMCAIDFIDTLIETGIASFKIEGRKRSPEYIAKVVSTYRNAIDEYFDGKLTDDRKKEMLEDLRTVYNRGFSDGFYLGEPENEFTEKYGSQATTRKIYVGKVLNYFKKARVAHVRMQAGSVQLGDKVYVIGETTGCVETSIATMIREEKTIEQAEKGEDFTFLCGETVRKNDQIYKIIPAEKRTTVQ